MAGPELDDGFTRIANEILEEVARRKFNGTQHSILLIVWRYTYGFNRKSHELSVRFLSTATKTDERTIKLELKRLVDSKVLKVAEPFHGSKSRKLSFNKYFSQWLEVGKTPPPKKKSGGEENTTKGVSNSPPLLGGNSPPKKERKKNIKKEEICMETPPGKIKFHDTVFLTLEQYERLCADFGKNRVDNIIEALDEWQTNNPKKQRKDHNKTIRVWIKRDLEKQKSKSQTMNGALDTMLQKELTAGDARRSDRNPQVHQQSLPEFHY